MGRREARAAAALAADALAALAIVLWSRSANDTPTATPPPRAAEPAETHGGLRCEVALAGAVAEPVDLDRLEAEYEAAVAAGVDALLLTRTCVTAGGDLERAETISWRPEDGDPSRPSD